MPCCCCPNGDWPPLTPLGLDVDDAAALLACRCRRPCGRRPSRPDPTPAARAAPGGPPCRVAGVDHVRRDQDRAHQEHDQSAEAPATGWRRRDAASGRRHGGHVVCCRPSSLGAHKTADTSLRAASGRPAGCAISPSSRPRSPPRAVRSRRSARRSPEARRRRGARVVAVRPQARPRSLGRGPGQPPQAALERQQRGARPGSSQPSRASARRSSASWASASSAGSRPVRAPVEARSPRPRRRRASTSGSSSQGEAPWSGLGQRRRSRRRPPAPTPRRRGACSFSSRRGRRAGRQVGRLGLRRATPPASGRTGPSRCR